MRECVRVLAMLLSPRRRFGFASGETTSTIVWDDMAVRVLRILLILTHQQHIHADAGLR